MIIAVDQLRESDIDIAVRPLVVASDHGAAMCRLLEETKITFDANGVTFPYPWQDMYSYQPAHAHG